MKYNFNIILNGQMEANTEQELVEKIASIINRNPAFQQIRQVFDIKIDRDSIISEEDEVIFDKIAEDFNLEREDYTSNFYGIPIEMETITHEVAINDTKLLELEECTNA